ncbi:MAG: hypothetical protein AcusKO_30780 [Acuticoccus sp.]
MRLGGMESCASLSARDDNVLSETREHSCPTRLSRLVSGNEERPGHIRRRWCLHRVRVGAGCLCRPPPRLRSAPAGARMHLTLSIGDAREATGVAVVTRQRGGQLLKIDPARLKMPRLVLATLEKKPSLLSSVGA